jgi:hypothetical protein
LKRRPFATSGTTSKEANGYDAPSMQTLGVDGYFPEPVIATFQQVGKYKLPLGSVSNQNNGGVLRRDGVGDLNSRPNVYMPQWSAPSRGTVVNQTGGMVLVPLNSYEASQAPANAFVANADQASLLAQFMASRSPRYAGLSSMSGE